MIVRVARAALEEAIRRRSDGKTAYPDFAGHQLTGRAGLPRLAPGRWLHVRVSGAGARDLGARVAPKTSQAKLIFFGPVAFEIASL